jgi:competence protein ComEA
MCAGARFHSLAPTARLAGRARPSVLRVLQWIRSPVPDPAVVRRRLQALAGLVPLEEPPAGLVGSTGDVVEPQPKVQTGGLGRALVALAVAAILVAGWLTWRAQGGDTTASVVRAGNPLLGSEPSASATGPARQMVVQVVGAVKRPGVVHLAAGSRVADAVAAAGGVRKGATAGLLNLARRVVDGEQIVVGVVVGGPTPTGAGGSTTAVRIDLNTADLAALDTLPGVGPVTAQRILDWRAAHQRFASVEQLREVEGIGQATYARLSPLVSVDGQP